MPIRGSSNGARHTPPQAGRDRPERVVAINRNARSRSIGTRGRNGPVRARSNGFLSLNARRQPKFERFAKLVAHEEWIADPRFKDPRARVANGDALMALIRPIIATRPTADWSRLLAGIDVLHAAVHTYQDLFQDDQVQAVGALTWIDDPTFGRVPMGSIAGQPAPKTGDRLSKSPGLGEHSREILLELGQDAAEIERLVGAGTVQGMPPKA